jgi:ubiquinone/menaquinone biosynthesis C-methylase UbiE
MNRRRALEVGAGTGLNLEHHTSAVTELVSSEQDAAMACRLARRLQTRGPEVQVAPAEALPFAEDNFDTVVSSLILCTFADPEPATAEVMRVLRPGGQLLFIEHFRAEGRMWRAAQRVLREPWRRFAVGCVCDRPTVRRSVPSGSRSPKSNGRWRGMPAVVKQLVSGGISGDRAAGQIRGSQVNQTKEAESWIST